ncbi:hypothetical protein [Brevibacillus choshinensis]|uniref:Uncharacterized protein n=1 Tax=Brevibacillus choshinensis TaxID=54911 RepID=A0ABX7FLC8_BRECH|nr:hypothetical protein [Brevibacillus choshinensis]QRG66440.1 hypothetical protein JNE38_23340 [Brevibacillus choshinensis]
MLSKRRLVVFANRYDKPVAGTKSDPKGPGVAEVPVVPIVTVIPITTPGADISPSHENPPFIYLLSAYAGGQAMLGQMQLDK